MPPTTNQKSRLPRDPDMFGPALAHIVLAKGDRDEVLGQAWIAAPNTLITCGHVVDQFTRSPGSLTVKFPASGNRYVIKEIKLHPSFQHADGELVKFDVAALIVDLKDPESSAFPLPITYEKAIEQQQTLSAIRYPSHLGVYTTSLSPLAQIGSYLNPLKKSDRFHLLHDLALAPGDSGTALFDGESVVAIHCGDTATLPGLNLPTTSIRLALSVDALMALDVPESSGNQPPNFINLLPAIAAFLVCGIITLGVFAFQYKDAWSFKTEPNFLINVALEKPAKDYKFGDELRLTVTSRNSCYIYVYYTQDDIALQLHPPPKLTSITAEARRNESFVIHGYDPEHPFQIDDKPGGNFHLVALIKDMSLLSKEEAAKTSADTCQIAISASELQNRLLRLKKDHPNEVLYQAIKPPVAQSPG